MPELPEVETVKETLKKILKNKVIKEVNIYYNNIIAYPTALLFKQQIKGQMIHDIERRGKWLMFRLDDYYLLSHLRMEGRYYVKKDEERSKHEHIIFEFEDFNLRYVDTRKFGRMYLIPIKEVYNMKPLSELGLEPWDNDLDISYLKGKYKNKKIPIKTILLDQSIISGIGNIYDDEILFMSHINPYEPANLLDDTDLNNIIINTRKVLEKAIKLGGTTIRSYESSEGVHGRFQNELLVHGKDSCPICHSKIEKVYINGRGTYYCSKCQQNKEVK